MKYIILGILSLALFAGTIAGALYFTGNLNEESLQRVLGREVAPDPDAPPAASTSVGPLAEALREKEQEIAEREAALAERERQVAIRIEEISRLQAKLEELQDELDTSMDNADTARQERIRVQAISIAAMKAQNAAQLLMSFSPEEAADILYFESGGKSIIDTRAQGAILDALDTDFATSLLRAHQSSASATP
jgi:flagellar motility protein MotE (MotC chaperone)